MPVARLQTLDILSETEFLERARARIASGGANREPSEPLFEALESENADPAQERPLYTPAAVAELVGVSIASVRRWYRRGFLTATFQRDRLPLFSTREVLVARRLAFLFSGDLAEEFVARRLLAFAGLSAPRGAEFDALRDAPFDVGAVILQTTLSSDGREPLFLGVNGPIDGEGQRRFEFNAFPTDGSFETPEPPPALSPDEEQIALAERLASWNAKETALSGKPAFLTLFQPSEDETRETEPEAPQAQEEPRETLAPKGIDVVAQCERAWNLEREGYWEEAERGARGRTRGKRLLPARKNSVSARRLSRSAGTVLLRARTRPRIRRREVRARQDVRRARRARRSAPGVPRRH